MKYRIGPVADPTGQAVLDRIEMDVTDVPPNILVVADAVPPKAPLPDAEIPVFGS